jgi:hypothetical protein
MVRGKLLRMGRVVLDSLDVTLQDPPPGSAAGWTGSFGVPATMTTPHAGGSYQLQLADGRTGPIRVERVEWTSDQSVTYFQGTGPLE